MMTLCIQKKKVHPDNMLKVYMQTKEYEKKFLIFLDW